MIHQREDVVGHNSELVLRGVIQFCGIAMAAIVERDDAAAVLLQVGDPGRIDPVDVLARGKAMHEQNRIALAFVEIGNFNSAVVETRHWQFRFWESNRRWGNERKFSRAPSHPPVWALAACAWTRSPPRVAS